MSCHVYFIVTTIVYMVCIQKFENFVVITIADTSCTGRTGPIIIQFNYQTTSGGGLGRIPDETGQV